MDDHGVRVKQVRVLRGPNLHAFMPALEIILDIGPYETRPSDEFPGFVERLTSWLPGLATHECSVGRPGGFVERLRRGTYLAHIAEHVCLELQGVMGFDVSYGRARGTGTEGVYRVTVAYEDEEPAKEAFRTALRLTLAAMHDEPFDVADEVERLKDMADEYRLGPSTTAIVQAARRRRIPILRITPKAGLVQLGWGVHQRRIQASETSNTSAIAVDMCQEKPLTNQMLSAVGVPVPEGQSVRSADDAWEAAQDVGVPVVVKPEDGNQGKGVSVDLTTEEQVRAAFEIADSFRRGVMVERYVKGDDYRLLIVGGKMVAAARRDPAQVVGDGEHTVAELVHIVNQDPRRRPGHSSSMTRIRLDSAADLVLKQQGLDRDSVPAEFRVVKLRTNANLSTGGTATDVTDEVHPRNARLGELAAQILGLDIAGIDVLCDDIGRPLQEQGGAIVEVNAAPGLRMHLHPSAGQPRDVGTPIIEMLYPNGAPSRIPIIAVTGTNGKTTVTRLIAHMYETGRYVVGRTSTEGTFIGKDRIMEGDCSGPRSARAVLLHPHVQVAVLETARGGILREGLAFDACRVGVVTNVTADHLGIGGVETIDDLVKVKQVVVENVARDGAAVLNAEDPRVAEMAAACDGEVIYFSARADHPVVRAHRAGGGRCVYVDDGRIVLTGKDGFEVELVELERVPFTAGGKIPFQVQNALAATAAAWAAGLNPAMIVRALTTFDSDPATVPGRFNVVQLRGVQVVFDYGHNPAALEALGGGIAALGPRKTVMLLALPGDRRDGDLVQSLEATRAYAHEYVFYDPDPRGRAVGEVPRLLQSHLPDGVPSEIAITKDEAFRAAWARCNPGDRLIVIVDYGDDVPAMLQMLAGSAAEDPRCETPIAAEAGSR